MTAIPLTLQYMRRILLVGDADEDTMAGLATHCDVLKQVHLADLESLNDEPYDCIIFADVPQDVHVTAAGRLLDVHGAAYFFDPPSMPESTGLRAYVEWDWHGRRVCMTVSKSYDPVHHARELFKRGHPEMSLEVLMNVPDGFSSTPHDMARLASEKQLCYLAWDQTAEPGERLNRFFREQREFYKAVTAAPHHHPAYIWHAEFWRRIGDEGMAARLLRSIEHVAPDDSVRRQLTTLNPAPVDHAAEDPPVWSGEFRPRILIMCHNHSDYGLDTLYDGLIRLLGPDNVIEFPWKPTLHGQAPERAHGYPCTFNHPGEPWDIERVRARLAQQYFDVIVYADTLMQLDREMVRGLLRAAGATPLFIVDTWDDGGDYLQDTLNHIGCATACAYFKREMLQCAQYPPNTYPLPFSYPEDRVPLENSGPRTIPLFWAGKRQDGLRRLYLEHVESKHHLNLNVRYTQEEYAHVLDSARLGLNLFGLGFDTVRYWELPAHGCMLLSERPPIFIPHNFREGEHAVFFDDAAELDDRLEYYLAHPEQGAAIADAGHAHFLRYHTSAARARQMLGRVEQRLRGD